jgi:uncharacterized repeat protein (TIGR03803 family)
MTNKVYAMAFLAVLVLAALAQAQTFTTLYSFTGGSDGGQPWAGLIQDPAGNLYGTAWEGGDLNCNAPNGCGVVFEVNTAGTETVLDSFSGSASGEWPHLPVARNKAGNLYGTTADGGSNGYGTVFRVKQGKNGKWKGRVLYSFVGEPDGCYPNQGLVIDNAGNLYGTTSQCGFDDYGTIFEVDGAGNFTLLHSFAGSPSDGAYPGYGHLTIDKSGNLYGVTTGGGAYNDGVLYELSKNGTFTVLHSYAGGTSDGCVPWGTVAMDKAGNFYGTTVYCGTSSNGTVWKVSNKGEETILHNFAGGSSDGCYPPGGVARDSKGNLYGVTQGCGANAYYGALYELSAKGELTLLHSFDKSDGAYPVGEVLRTTQNTLYGTTSSDGTYGYGTVWSYVP